jgi:small GTP-binding protein
VTEYQQYKSQTLSLFDQCIGIALKLGDEDSVQALAAEKQRLTNDELIVVLAGEFKRGKSTLLNNLLGKSYCPVENSITTAVLTAVRYGERERVTVHFSDAEGSMRSKEVPLTEIPQYVSEQYNRQNRLEVRLVEVEAPLETLVDRVAFFDTPGVGGLNALHSEVTIRALMKADVVMYVFDATSPLSKTETDFISKWIGDDTQVLFVMTKKDLVDLPDQVAQENAQKFAHITSRRADEISIVPVNNLAYQSFLRTGDREDLEQSNLEALRSTLWEMLRTHRGSIIIGRALTVLQHVIENSSMPLKVESDALLEKNKAVIEQERLRLEEEKKRREELLSDHSHWVSSLTRELSLLQNDLRASMERKLIKTSQEMHESVEQPRFRDDPERLETLLNNNLAGVAVALENELEEGAARIYSGLALEAQVSSPSVTPKLDLDLRLHGPEQLDHRRRSSWSASMEKLRSAVAYGMAAGVLGQLMGPIGGVLGVVGAVHGWREAKLRMKEHEQNEVSRALAAHFGNELHSAKVEMGRRLTEAVARNDYALRDEIQRVIRTQQKVIEESLARISRSVKSKEADNQAQLQKVTGPLNELRAIQTAAMSLVTVLQLGGGKRAAASPGAQS